MLCRHEAALRKGGAMKGGLRRLRRILARTVLAFAVFSLLWVALYRFADPPGTPLMLIRWVQGYPPGRETLALSDISPRLVRAVIGAEDSRFCRHFGFDWQAISDAWESNQESGRLRGASTISMQTAKNLFLWPGRDWLRKGAEAYFTLLIEAGWSKRRIIELYLNNVEWGPGVYGAEAAARHHFGVSAKALSDQQAALLATVLPSPLKWSAGKPSSGVLKRAAIYRQRMAIVARDALDACVYE
jgi:monofunctional biosynthetic peptidoglycan transglycosylase